MLAGPPTPTLAEGVLAGPSTPTLAEGVLAGPPTPTLAEGVLAGPPTPTLAEGVTPYTYFGGMRLEFEDMIYIRQDIICREILVFYIIVACLITILQVSTIASACYLTPEEQRGFDV